MHDALRQLLCRERTPLWFELSHFRREDARWAHLKQPSAAAIFGVERTRVFIIDATPVGLGIIPVCLSVNIEGVK